MIVAEQLVDAAIPNASNVFVDDSFPDESILTIQDTSPHPLADSEWYGDIVRYLTQQEYHPEASNKVRSHNRATARQ